MDEKNEGKGSSHLRSVEEGASIRSPDAVITNITEGEKPTNASDVAAEVNAVRAALSAQDAHRVIDRETSSAASAAGVAKRYLVGTLSHLALALTHVTGDLNDADRQIDKLVGDIMETHKLITDLDVLIEGITR